MKTLSKVSYAVAILLGGSSLLLLNACSERTAQSQNTSAKQTQNHQMPPPPPGGKDFGGPPPDFAGGPPPGPPPGGFGQGFGPGGSHKVDHGTYAYAVTGTVSDKTYQGQGNSENVVRVEKGQTASLSNVEIDKIGGNSAQGDASNFYGANAGLLALDGADVTLNHATVNTNANGANGIFAYGAGTQIHIHGIHIRTQQGSSGGVMVAGGGQMWLDNGDIETQGRSSAALRSDRGGGKLVVNGGHYLAHGEGSPAIYSTADISVSNAVLEATTSEAVVIEGKNQVHLINSQVTGHMQRPGVTNLQNVMLYQSMSGDAEQGESVFSMVGGSLTGLSGDMFYVTNTHSKIYLENVKLQSATDLLLHIAGNTDRRGWGRQGHNGGICETVAVKQQLAGNILVDDISQLNLSLSKASQFTGAINSTKQQGNVEVTLDNSSKWALTADSHVSSFNGELTNVISNGHHLFVAGKQLL